MLFRERLTTKLEIGWVALDSSRSSRQPVWGSARPAGMSGGVLRERAIRRTPPGCFLICPFEINAKKARGIHKDFCLISASSSSDSKPPAPSSGPECQRSGLERPGLLKKAAQSRRFRPLFYLERVTMEASNDMPKDISARWRATCAASLATRLTTSPTLFFARALQPGVMRLPLSCCSGGTALWCRESY